MLQRQRQLDLSVAVRREIDRFERVVYSLEVFWAAVDREIKKLKTDDVIQFSVPKIRARVVEKRPLDVRLESDGKVKVFSLRRNNMRAELASALAERGMADRGTGRLLPLASFWSLTQESGREFAIELWRRAHVQGLPVAVLDASVVVRTRDESG